MHQSIPQTPSHVKTFVACLLSFMLFITPITALAGTAGHSPIPRNPVATDAPSKAQLAESELFVNQPVEMPAMPAAQPEPAPEPPAPFAPIVGSVTATKTAALTVTANNGDGKADPGDTINYTVQLGNTSGSDGTGITFSDTLDTHTTLSGTVNSTPVAFDQTGVATVVTNEDAGVSITIQGQDPDGTNLTFTNISSPANGALGVFSAPSCVSGICSSTATYTPNANFSGSDSFNFKVNDGTSPSNETGTVSITVNAVNDAPTFTVPGNPAATNEDAGAISVSSFITAVRPAQVGNTTEDSQTVSFVITNNTNPGLFSSGPALNVAAPTGPFPTTATLTYTSALNQNGTAVITYHAHDNGGTANSGVDNSADQTFTITVNAVNDPPVVVAPAAYSATANMKVTGLTGLLGNVNDNADNGVNGCVSTPFTVTNGSISATSPAGGIISNPNLSTGTFDFEPPPGATGDVTFTYTVSDTGCGSGTPGISAPVTVHVTVTGPVIWFVNPAAGVNGTGTLNSPFNLLASANTAMGINAGQRIFVYTGTTTSGVGVTLTTSQWLIGQGATDASNTTNFDTLMGISPPANTIARPAVNGTKPTIQGRVQMNASNTRVQGVAIAPPAGTQGLTATNGAAMTGMQVGVSAAKSDVTITATGISGTNAMGVSLNNAGGVFSLISVNVNQDASLNKPAKGISLTSTTGSFTVLGTGSAGTGGTIQNVSARGAEFTTAANVTLKYMNFTNATSADGADPTVQSGTCGVAHSGGSNTGCNAPIFMNGVNVGNLDTITVSGSSQMGININASNDLTMNAVNVSGAGNNPNEFGMNIHNLTGTNNWSGINIHDNPGANHQVYVEANSTASTGTFNITGSSQFTCALSGGTTRVGGNLLSFDGYGSSANMTVSVTGATFSGSSATALLFHTQQTSGTSSLTVTTSSFTNNNSQIDVAKINGATLNYSITNNTPMTGANFGEAINIYSGAPSSGTMSGTISGNTIGTAGVAGSGCTGGCGGIFVTSNNAGTVTANILNNHISRVSSNAINATAGGPNGGVNGSPTNTININVTGNTIDNPDSNTVNAIFIESGTSSTGASAIVCAKIGDVTGTVAADKNVITGNWGGGQFDPFDSPILLRNRFAIDIFRIAGWSPTSGTVNSSHDVSAQNFVISHNTITANSGPNGSGHTVSATVGATAYTGGAPTSCPLLLAEGGVMAALNAPALTESFFRFGLNSSDYQAIDLESAIAATGTISTSLDQLHLNSIVSSAIARWASTGLTPQQIATLHGIKFDVADLSGAYLGEADGNHILVDRNAQSKGWFIDSTPRDDSEFGEASGTRRYTDSMSTPAGHVDLLTAVMHEMGHKLGLDDSYQEQDRDNLMYGYLTVGERRLPSQGQAKFAQASALQGTHFLSLSRGNDQAAKQLNHARSVRRKQSSSAAMAPVFAPVPPPPGTITINGVGSGFKLPNGKTITIKFSVTLNNPPNLAGVTPPRVINQGTLSGGFIGNPIVTDDPSTGAANDATVTLVDLFDTTTSVSSSQNPSFVGQNVKFTATVASAGGVPTGQVQFKDGATNLGAAVALTTGGTCPVGSACATTPDISSLTAGTHVITADYTNSDGNFDPSTGTLAGGQVVNSKTNTTTTVLSSLNPSNVGDGVTFTAQVNSASATGTVQFWDGPSGTGVALGSPVTLTTGGSCPAATACASTASITTLTAGTHTITADYSGDAGFNSSTATLAGGQVVNKKATTTVVTSSPNPSNIGESVTLTATVSAASGTPTGTVQFKDGGVDIGSPQTLNGSGVGTLITSFASSGAHSITAVYSGDGTFLASDNTATPYTQNVNTCSATEVVANTNDTGAGSLRAAIANVCTGGTITFDPAVFTTAGSPHVINLADANGELLINKAMTITGPGAGIVTVQRDGTATTDFRVFRISNTTTTGPVVSISGLTISNGRNIDGGGIYNDHGTLTVTNVIVSGNTAVSGNGGAIYNDGRTGGGAVLNVTDSTLSSNTALTGGAIYNDGLGGNATATINGSTLNGNTADDGGAIHNEADATFSATLNINNSTISGNFANNNGGGLHNFGPTAVATLTGVTITGNHADNDDSAAGAGGGINVSSGTVTLKNTIVAGNVKGTATPTADDIAGTINTTASASTFNLIGDAATAGGLVDATDNNIVGDVGGTGTRPIATILNTTLANNGGPTKTHALANNSQALEKGNAFTLTTDQRGFPRPVDSDAGVTGAGDESDIGAFEAQTAPAAPGAPNLDAVSDSGTNTADNKTNVTTNLSFTITPVINGATVELFRDGVSVASGVASSTTIQLTDPGTGITFDADGTDYVYTAKQSLGAGNTSVASAGLTVNINIIPDAPVLDPASDSGTLGDGITNDTSPTFNITNVIATATIKLFRDGTQVASGTAAGTTIQLTDPSAPNGTFTYTATQDFSAVTSVPSAGTSITITIQPNAPDLDATSDTGNTTDNYTADSTPTFNLSGVIVGANVELLRDGTSVASNASAGSTTIQLTDPGAADGLHTYKVRQTVGVTLSPDSAGLDVTIDTVNNPPSMPDLDSASDSNITTDNYTNDNTPTFSGTAEANSTVRLYANAVLKGTATASNAGAWSITATVLADNSYSITADSTDIAGTTSSPSSALNPVIIDTGLPSVTMTSGVGNPTATTPIPVTVTFNESVTGFTSGDIVAGNGTVGNFAGGPAVYTFDLTPAGPGAVSADIAGGVAIDLAGNSNTAATQFNRTYDPSALSASITAVSPDPRNTSVSSIQIVFNKAVTGFDLPDLTLKLNGGANLLTGAQTLTSGDNITWTLGNLSALTAANGTYVLLLTAAGSNIKDSANNPLTGDASDTWVMDTTPLTVTVNQAAGQADPVTGPIATTVINFTAVFNKPVADFTNSDVTIGGTAGATVANISQIAPNDGTTYNVAIEGMTGSGTVIASILANRATDNAGNQNTASTSTDNTVTFFKDDFTTLVVNSLADPGDGPCTAIGIGDGCTLREAINAANADAGADTITFNVPTSDPGYNAGTGVYTINLASALPDLTDDVTIQGLGANVLTVKRNVVARFRIFTINSGKTVNISGLTISNGFTADNTNGDIGGGIFNNGTLTLTAVAVSGNRTGAATNPFGAGGPGGGIASGGTGTLTIINSTINGNQTGAGGSSGSGGDGGGIASDGVTLTIINSTISGNQTGAGGGGAGGFGGGISHFTAGTMTLTGTTITGNFTGGSSARGGGIYRGPGTGTVTLKNTIVGGNTAATAPDISGTVQSDGFNLIQSTSGATINANPGAGPNITGQDPKLDTNGLQDNGGPTKTISLQCVSPAIDKGFKFGLSTDQRGGTRPFDLADSVYPNAVGGDGSDIGAYETQSGGGCLPLAVTPATQVTDEDTPGTFTLTGTFSQNATLTFTISQAPTHGATGAPSAPNCTFTTFTTCTSTVVYTPSPNYNGPDFFKFIVSAGPGLDSDPADVNVTVNAVNDPPVALFDGYSTPENTLLTVAAPGVLTNDTDVDSVSLTAVLGTGPAHAASFALNANGSFNYTPVAGFSGTDSFTYRAFDGSLSSNLATVTIAVNEGGAIHFTSLTYSVSENGSDAVISIARTGGSAGIATALFYTTDGTATAGGGDYTTVSQTVTFNDGETAKTVNVPITEDFINEPDETVTLTLTNAGGSGEIVAPNIADLTILNDDPTGGYVQFNSAAYTVAENGGGIDITVNRIGTSTLPVTVHYATSDMTASERMDYTTTLGTLSFAAGETTKTFTVLVNQDAFAEGSELLGLTLTNATGGATLGVPQNATLQINDSLWTPPPANAIDDAGFFVRQHYHDFLNREPDAPGLAFWTNQISSCGSDAACIDIRRINVSAAFFLSIEYQETGFIAFLANRAAFGPTLPRYRGFVEDTQALQRGFIFTAPGSAAVLEANKVAYFNSFVFRPDFAAIYGSLSNGQYVDGLIANTGATFTTAERDALVEGLNNATETRATVLRKITEKPSFKASQFNRAFVLMQYFGYLRRNPDDAPDNNLNGFNFWLDKLNQFNGNFVNADMVKAFILSAEYRQRFGN